MSAWWWLLVPETCSKIYIIEYIVVFWLKDFFLVSSMSRQKRISESRVKAKHNVMLTVHTMQRLRKFLHLNDLNCGTAQNAPCFFILQSKMN
jgi:hypothetical protein